MTNQTIDERIRSEIVKQRNLVEQGHYSRIIADEKLDQAIKALILEAETRARIDEAENHYGDTVEEYNDRLAELKQQLKGGE